MNLIPRSLNLTGMSYIYDKFFNIVSGYLKNDPEWFKTLEIKYNNALSESYQKDQYLYIKIKKEINNNKNIIRIITKFRYGDIKQMNFHISTLLYDIESIEKDNLKYMRNISFKIPNIGELNTLKQMGIKDFLKGLSEILNNILNCEVINKKVFLEPNVVAMADKGDVKAHNFNTFPDVTDIDTFKVKEELRNIDMELEKHHKKHKILTKEQQQQAREVSKAINIAKENEQNVSPHDKMMSQSTFPQKTPNDVKFVRFMYLDPTGKNPNFYKTNNIKGLFYKSKNIRTVGYPSFDKNKYNPKKWKRKGDWYYYQILDIDFLNLKKDKDNYEKITFDNLKEINDLLN